MASMPEDSAHDGDGGGDDAEGPARKKRKLTFDPDESITHLIKIITGPQPACHTAKNRFKEFLTQNFLPTELEEELLPKSARLPRLDEANDPTWDNLPKLKKDFDEEDSDSDDDNVVVKKPRSVLEAESKRLAEREKMLKAVQNTSASALQKVIDGMADLMKVHGTNKKEIDVFVANVKSKIFRVDGGGASSATPTTTGAVAPVASTDAAAKPIAPPAGKANKTPAPTTTAATTAKFIARPTGKTDKPSNNGAAPKAARH